MPMHRTRSASPATAATSPGSLSGLKATPAPRPSARAARTVSATSSTASKWNVTLSPPSAATGAKYFAGRSTIRCTSRKPPWRWTIGEIDCSTIGPIVTGSTKWPSPTSKWKTRQPASHSSSICAPSRAKSAAYSDGSTSKARIRSLQGIAATILRVSPEAGDEEAGGIVAMRQREQELRPPRVRVLRPLLAERLDREPGRVDHRLVLVGVHGADRVDDRAARPDTLGGRSQELELQLGQRPRPPAEVRPPRQDAEARAWRVDERAVEAARVELAHVRRDDADVRRRLRGERARPTRIDLHRGHVAVQEPRLAARRSARVEDPLAVARAHDQRGELRGAAHRTHPREVDAIDDVRAGDVRRLADRLRRVHLERGRAVLRAHQLEGGVATQVAPPDVGDPVGVRELERPVGERRDESAEALRQPAHDRVRERHRALASRRPDEL